MELHSADPPLHSPAAPPFGFPQKMYLVLQPRNSPRAYWLSNRPPYPSAPDGGCKTERHPPSAPMLHPPPSSLQAPSSLSTQSRALPLAVQRLGSWPPAFAGHNPRNPSWRHQLVVVRRTSSVKQASHRASPPSSRPSSHSSGHQT